MVHRGLRNKWSDSPATILFRLAGTIKHLNELNRGDLVESMLFGLRLDFIKFVAISRSFIRKLILTY